MLLTSELFVDRFEQNTFLKVELFLTWHITLYERPLQSDVIPAPLYNLLLSIY